MIPHFLKIGTYPKSGVGPILFGPLSEHFGRKPVLSITYSIYLIFTMACALAPNFPALLIFRFFCGFGGSAPNAVLGGLFSDIYEDPHQRGLAMSWFMFATTFPPLLGPIISGFISTITWRWSFWAGLLIAAPGFPLLITMPETYVPILRAKRRKSTDEKGARDTDDLSEPPKGSFFAQMSVVLSRPFLMFIHEPIVFCCSMYLALVYAILYLYFQAYPIVFQSTSCNSSKIPNLLMCPDLYGLSAGISGLGFLPSEHHLPVNRTFLTAFSPTRFRLGIPGLLPLQLPPQQSPESRTGLGPVRRVPPSPPSLHRSPNNPDSPLLARLVLQAFHPPSDAHDVRSLLRFRISVDLHRSHQLSHGCV